MPKELTPPILASSLKLRTLSYAIEDRGDPAVPTLVLISKYDLLDAAGKVVGSRAIGSTNVRGLAGAINPLMAVIEAELRVAEGL